jgi:hypothetical protein
MQYRRQLEERICPLKVLPPRCIDGLTDEKLIGIHETGDHPFAPTLHSNHRAEPFALTSHSRLQSSFTPNLDSPHDPPPHAPPVVHSLFLASCPTGFHPTSAPYFSKQLHGTVQGVESRIPGRAPSRSRHWLVLVVCQRENAVWQNP